MFRTLRRSVSSRFSVSLAAALVVMLTAACKEPPAGTAGISPAHWPNAQAADWTTYRQQQGEVGSQLGVHVAWNTSGDGVIPNCILAALANGARPVVVLGLKDVAGNPDKLAALEGMVRQLVTSYPIDFLAFGNEINDDPTVDVLLPLIEHMAQFTKALGTPTQVFTVFQYESMLTNPKAASYLAQVPSLAFVGFTSYPFLKYSATSQMPTTYYDAIAKWTTKAWALTEVGWPSRQSFPGYPTIKGSEAEQVNFISKVANILPNKPVVFVNWFTVCDLAEWKETDPVSNFNQVFYTIGLRRNSGTAKQAYEAWRQFYVASKSA
jgi:hypothetical protein